MWFQSLGWEDPLEVYRASLIAQLVKNLPAMQETLVQFLGQEDPLEKGRLPTSVFWPGESHGLLYNIYICIYIWTEQGKPFIITVIQAYAPTSNAEEAEVERFYEDLQDLLELTPKKYVLFIIGDWNAKVGSQGTPGVTGKFGLGVWNEAG